MPLKVGKSKGTIVANYKEMKASGHPEDVSWAVAYETARRAGGHYPRKKRKKKKHHS